MVRPLTERVPTLILWLHLRKPILMHLINCWLKGKKLRQPLFPPKNTRYLMTCNITLFPVSFSCSSNFLFGVISDF